MTLRLFPIFTVIKNLLLKFPFIIPCEVTPLFPYNTFLKQNHQKGPWKYVQGSSCFLQNCFSERDTRLYAQQMQPMDLAKAKINFRHVLNSATLQESKI